MDTAETIIKDLRAVAEEDKRLSLPHFFKTGKGEYGEGDVFLGVVIPKIRKVAKAHRFAQPEELHKLLMSKYHEVRMCALMIMVQKCERKDPALHKDMLDLYLQNIERVNNWDLVDLSAPAIVGEYLSDKPRDLLYQLAESHKLWKNRIAVVATWALIRRGDLDDIYTLAVKMMNLRQDLIRKAIGWMLREAGKKDKKRLFDFIETYREEMPRTMLRYAIEKFPEDERAYLMKK